MRSTARTLTQTTIRRSGEDFVTDSQYMHSFSVELAMPAPHVAKEILRPRSCFSPSGRCLSKQHLVLVSNFCTEKLSPADWALGFGKDRIRTSILGSFLLVVEKEHHFYLATAAVGCQNAAIAGIHGWCTRS